jgi:hypothetical protein
MRGLCAIVVLFCSIPVLAAGLADEANAAYAAKDWKLAATLYQQVVDASGSDGRAWYRLGVSRHQSGAYPEAIAAFLRATELGFAPPYTFYGLAAATARTNDAKKACEYLDSALNSGFRDEAGLAADHDFDSIRSAQCFVSFVANLESRLHPCRKGAHRALDFWVGEWDVRDSAAGHRVGTSTIERILDDCVVLENWSGALGGEGKSFNTIDGSTGKWRQTWTDSSGSIYDFTGKPGEARMVFERNSVAPDGKPLLIRMTLSALPTGEVRQLSEQSLDGGKSWAVGYDFTYARRTTK